LKIFKLVKLMRPLRAIAVNQNLKIAIQAVSIALEDILNLIVVLILFLFVFGIITVNYFRGQFYRCIPN
jgi:hypothetical protein